MSTPGESPSDIPTEPDLFDFLAADLANDPGVEEALAVAEEFYAIETGLEAIRDLREVLDEQSEEHWSMVYTTPRVEGGLSFHMELSAPWIEGDNGELVKKFDPQTHRLEIDLIDETGLSWGSVYQSNGERKFSGKKTAFADTPFPDIASTTLKAFEIAEALKAFGETPDDSEEEAESMRIITSLVAEHLLIVEKVTKRVQKTGPIVSGMACFEYESHETLSGPSEDVTRSSLSITDLNALEKTVVLYKDWRPTSIVLIDVSDPDTPRLLRVDDMLTPRDYSNLSGLIKPFFEDESIR